MAKIEAPHVGKMIWDYRKSKRISHSSWQQVSGKSYNTIIRYQKQRSMRVDTLFLVCQTLNFNFLRQIADMLPDSIPPQRHTDRQAEIDELQNKVKLLENQVATLEKALSLIGGR